ncbi:MAG: carbon-nitrogen hydrolase [Syntrophaceae bacterium]|nr:carbon-nitrogen hydrolase [Syntrophaceae bacterium]
MGESRKIKVGFVQMACVPDIGVNMEHAMAGIRRAAAQGANIVCLQELFRSLYFCVTEDYAPFAMAEAIPGPSTEVLQRLAGELDVVIVASLFEKRAEGLYHNSAAVIDADGTYLGKYRKMHIPDDPSFYEKFYFTPGDLGFRVFKTKYGTIGVLICWDQWYPEAARLTALMGAEMLFYPTAIGWAQGEDPQICREQFDAWQTIQRAHAIANGIPVIAVNRVGKEGDITFWGGSFASNTLGEVIYQAPHEKEDIAVFEINLLKSDSTRKHWPFLRDRRIDAYDGLTRRFLDSDSDL